MQRILLILSYLASLFVPVISYHYIGCYKDSLSKPLFDGLEHNGPYINLDLSTRGCVDYCAKRKFSYMAVQNGIMCYCSNVLPTVRTLNWPKQSCYMLLSYLIYLFVSVLMILSMLFRRLLSIAATAMYYVQTILWRSAVVWRMTRSIQPLFQITLYPTTSRVQIFYRHKCRLRWSSVALFHHISWSSTVLLELL